MKILNLTQHVATPDQVAAGVVEPADKKRVQKFLTIEELPDWDGIIARSGVLATIARRSGCEAAMIGGAPYLMAPLERALREQGIEPLYAFSKRESVDEKQPDGSIKKTQVFRHAGFIRAT